MPNPACDHSGIGLPGCEVCSQLPPGYTIASATCTDPRNHYTALYRDMTVGISAPTTEECAREVRYAREQSLYAGRLHRIEAVRDERLDGASQRREWQALADQQAIEMGDSLPAARGEETFRDSFRRMRDAHQVRGEQLTVAERFPFVNPPRSPAPAETAEPDDGEVRTLWDHLLGGDQLGGG